MGLGTKGESGEKIQAMKYKAIFQFIEEAKKNGEINIDSVTFWGLYDSISWRTGENPLLFRMQGGLQKKEAWYGVMQDPNMLSME